MDLRSSLNISISVIVSLAVFFGFLFCTLEDVTEASVGEPSSVVDPDLHYMDTLNEIFSGKNHVIGQEQCCDELIATRPVQISVLPASIPLFSGHKHLIGESTEIKFALVTNFSKQTVYHINLSGRANLNKRKKTSLKIRPPFGPPA